MKITTFPSEENFCVRQCMIGGILCNLVFPHQIGIKWDHTNKIFRSSIWTLDGRLISAGYRKFTNVGEQPEFEPLNENGKLEYIHKVDGSCLIISKFRGELIVRTRGTISAEESMDNGADIPVLKLRYPQLFDNALLKSEQYSIIAEWFSPDNVIVERESDQPELWLTGIVQHEDYSYLPQKIVDDYAKSWGVPRPARYQFNTLPEMLAAVKEWRKGEGIVIYSADGQVLKKAKADRYLFIHRIKSQLNSEENFIELFISEGTPEYGVFYSYIQNTFDWELAEQMRGQISKVCDAYKRVKQLVDHMKEFVARLDGQDKSTRKEAAQMIMEAYGNTNRSAMAFQLLDGRELEAKHIKKLIYQCL